MKIVISSDFGIPKKEILIVRIEFYNKNYRMFIQEVKISYKLEFR